jgi:hypothetical protein
MFISGSEPTETSTRFSKLSAPTDLKVVEEGTIAHVTWTSPGLPSAVDKAYLESYFNSGYGKFATKYYQQRLEYNEKNIGDFGFEVYLAKGTTTKLVGWTANENYNIDLSLYPGTWDSVIVKSAYEIFKANASETVSAYLNTHVDPVTINIAINDVTISNGSTWSGSDKSAITSIKVNDEEITDYTVTLSISTIKNSNNEEVPINTMRTQDGEYKVTYLVTFRYQTAEENIKQYTQSVTQNVTVKTE